MKSERIRKLRMSQAKKGKKTRTKTSMQLLKRKRQNWPKWGKRQPRGRDGSRCNDTWLDEENYNKNFKGCWEWSEELCFHQDHFGRAAQTYHRAYWQVLGVNNYGKLRQYKIHAMQQYDYQQTSFIKCENCCSKSFSANRLFGSLTANCCSESYLVKFANSWSTSLKEHFFVKVSLLANRLTIDQTVHVPCCSSYGSCEKPWQTMWLLR